MGILLRGGDEDSLAIDEQEDLAVHGQERGAVAALLVGEFAGEGEVLGGAERNRLVGLFVLPGDLLLEDAGVDPAIAADEEGLVAGLLAARDVPADQVLVVVHVGGLGRG